MAARFHDGVERHFQNNLGFHFPVEAVVGSGVRHEPLGHVRDLAIGESVIGLANVDELVAVVDGEGVIAENACALAVSELDRGDYYVEGGELTLHLEPGAAAASGSVER